MGSGMSSTRGKKEEYIIIIKIIPTITVGVFIYNNIYQYDLARRHTEDKGSDGDP